ncbi:MAG: hypothetical protein JRI25_27020 [Deltaproteobacteria bacterium]|nr:hypothetical protein [Deltaproteobacteria bacterium]
MKNLQRWFGGLAVAGLMLVAEPASAMEVYYPFVFQDTFPGSAQHLGFWKGDRLAVGAASVVPGEHAVVRAVARNLDTGVELELSSKSLGTIYTGLYQTLPMPPFDPELHTGVWELEFENSIGEVVVAQTHELNMTEPMGFARDVQASMNEDGSVDISWSMYKHQQIPEDCWMRYRVRLLNSSDCQFFAEYVPDTFITIAAEDLVPGPTFPEECLGLDTWARIEQVCSDINDPSVAHEMRSNTFRPLEDLLLQLP